MYRQVNKTRWKSLFLEIALVCSVFFSGCALLTESEPVTQPAAVDAAAKTLLEKAQYAAASRAYLDLAAAASGAQKVEFVLAALDAAYQGKVDISIIKAMLRKLPPGTLSSAQEARVDLLRAQIALRYGGIERVPVLVRKVELPRLSNAFAAEALRSRADIYAAEGDMMGAVRERLSLALLLSDREAIAQNRLAIWDALTRVDEEVLLAELELPNISKRFAGWISLVLIIREYQSNEQELATQKQLWAERYPGHPGREVSALIHPEQQDIFIRSFKHVGLILPLSGPFAEVSQAIRDGFTMAWFGHGPVHKIRVSVFDSTDHDIRTLISGAYVQGVDLIVGPLEKENVRRVQYWAECPLPVLALNRSALPIEQAIELHALSDVHSTQPLYQFALDPEGEAVQVAERAWEQGLKRVAVLAPESDWGDRVAQAFTEKWHRLGGMVISSETYPDVVQEMSASIKALLNIDASEARRRQLRAVVGADRVKHESRRRQDIDFVFMAAFAESARSLKPLLDFFRASDLPVYATSHVFTGVVDTLADEDIERVFFPSMPWILAEDERIKNLRDQITVARPQVSSLLSPFYAFGFDAFLLIPKLGQHNDSSEEVLDGLTGRLMSDANRTFKRQLLWARIRKGVPKLLDDTI